MCSSSSLNRFEEIEEITIRGANDLQLYVTYDIKRLQAFRLVQVRCGSRYQKCLWQVLSRFFGQQPGGNPFYPS
jgi:hypothetical protein